MIRQRGRFRDFFLSLGMTAVAMTAIIATAVIAMAHPPSAFERHLQGTGTLLYRCSSINLIRGLNLTREQADALLQMARVIEAISPPIRVTGFLISDLQRTVQAFQRLENALKIGAKIPEGFRQELFACREEQSRIIRQGLRYDRASPVFACKRCHWVPGARKLGFPWIDKISLHPAIRTEKAVSHLNAPFGLVSLALVAWFSPRIDALLTPTQKAAIEKFSCCLLPPKDFSNPIRVGQAELGDWEVAFLEKSRASSRLMLPILVAGIKHFLHRGMKAVHPGVSGPALQEMRVRVDRVVRKARELGEIDFELQKRELGKELSGPLAIHVNERFFRFRNAVFLLMPGSVEMYQTRLEKP
jgi:hypothetical protein